LWEKGRRLLHKNISSSEMRTWGELNFSCSDHYYSWSKRWDCLWTRKKSVTLLELTGMFLPQSWGLTNSQTMAWILNRIQSLTGTHLLLLQES
jgi:hypothetical protein